MCFSLDLFRTNFQRFEAFLFGKIPFFLNLNLLIFLTKSHFTATEIPTNFNPLPYHPWEYDNRIIVNWIFQNICDQLYTHATHTLTPTETYADIENIKGSFVYISICHNFVYSVWCV